MKYDLSDIINVLPESTQDYMEYIYPEIYTESVSPLVIPIVIIGGLITKTIYDIDNTKKYLEEKEKQDKLERDKKDKKDIDDFISNINTKKVIFTLDNQALKLDTVSNVFDYLIKDIKIILNYIKKDSKYKQKINNEIEKYASEISKDKDDYNDLIKEMTDYKLITDVEKSSDRLIINIIDGGQETRLALDFILINIEKIINKKYSKVFNHFYIKTDSGSGDDGSLEFNVKNK